MKFKIYKDYYGDCDLFLRDEIEIKPGLTVLVGCNGAGKSTLILQMRDKLIEQKKKFLAYDNLRDGGDQAASWAGYCGDYAQMATMIQSSEGENIIINIGNFAKKVGDFVRKTSQKDIFIFFDAIDSGMSIDNIIEIKDFFKFVQKNDPDKTFYFIVSANEYEMACGQNCFDVYKGEYVEFKDYDAFKAFIVHSRAVKDGRKYKKIERGNKRE